MCTSSTKTNVNKSANVNEDFHRKQKLILHGRSTFMYHSKRLENNKKKKKEKENVFGRK